MMFERDTRKIIVMAAMSVVALAACLPATGQGVKQLDPDYYRPPMDSRLLLSANFAEARRDHFHSGIDIKTGGVEGKPLYAVADGYISRIGALPTGFGRVLYVAHPNGTTSVYAHMRDFTPEVEEYVNNERHRLRQHRVDLYPAAAKFPVKKGQLIGYSGNSGSSGGPHLHFEIRDSGSQKPLNLVTQNLFDIKDDILPTIVKIHYIETDTVSGVPLNSRPRTYEVRNISRGNYRLADTAAVMQLGPSGYFVLEATDRKNDTHNTMGIYKSVMRLDGRQIFSYALDGFLFGDSRYVNSFTHYQMQKGSRNEMLRLAVQTNNKFPVYSGVVNRGAIVLTDNEPRTVEIEVWDDAGNVSKLSFKVRLGSGGRKFHKESDRDGIVVDCRTNFTRSYDGVTVNIPSGALYESIFMRTGKREVEKPNMKMYSPLYVVHSPEVPIHKAMEVSIDVSGIEQSMLSKLCIARVGDDGKFYNAGGAYENGKVTASVRAFGNYCVVADNTPPVVKPSIADGADLRGKSSLTFTIGDNFSGVASFTATIDGIWIPFEQQGTLLTHYFKNGRVEYNGGEHTVIFTATDYKGNTTTVKRTFVR